MQAALGTPMHRGFRFFVGFYGLLQRVLACFFCTLLQEVFWGFVSYA